MTLPDAVLPKGLCLTDLLHEEETITVHARSITSTARCPLCHQVSYRIHSRYNRTLSDRAWGGMAVRLVVTVRKFYCPFGSCPREVFAERLEGLAKAHGRRTLRQREALDAIALALGGEAGARLALQLGLPISPDTLLRYIRLIPEPDAYALQVLGVDDWAWRKSDRYGTILVELERRCIADLLPERSSGSFAGWLAEHPGVQVISRDRGGEYAAGATQGAPKAIQVADRFHLIKNLSEAVENVLKRHIALLARLPSPDSSSSLPTPPRPEREAARQRTHNTRVKRNEAVQALARQGMSQCAIARALQLNRRTGGQSLRSDATPERPRKEVRSSLLAPYQGYILERCRQGYWNAMGLWREVTALGYPGQYKSVSRLVSSLRQRAVEVSRFPARSRD